MKRAILVLGILIAAVTMYSIHKKSAKSSILEGTYYLDQMLRNQEMNDIQLTSSEITFTNKSGKVSIYVGCNKISGAFNTSKTNQFKLGETMSTKMFCPDPTENEFLQLLSKATQFKIKGELLEFYQKNKLLMILKKKKKVVAVTEITTYEGHYKLESILIDGKMRTDDYSKSSVAIEKGRIQCSVGCNGIGGDFITKGEKILPLKLMMTEMYCESVAKLEQLFVEHLNHVDMYEVENDRLNFYLKGELVLVLKRI